MVLKNLFMDTSSRIVNGGSGKGGSLLAEFATSGDAEKCWYAINESFDKGDMQGLGDECVQSWTCHNYFTIMMEKDIDIVNDYILMICGE